MPNRVIRDGLLESEAVLSLPVEARWLYVSILLTADDVGLFEATPFRLARKADLRREAVDKLLPILADADLIRLYQVDGKQYGFIPKFQQRLQIKRIKHAPPPDALVSDDADALHKIKDLTGKTTVAQPCSTDIQQKITVAQPPEVEVEVEVETESLNQEAKKQSARARRAVFSPPPGVEVETWEAFARHRQSKRAAITEDGYRLLCKRLAGFREQGHDPNAALLKSIEQGWTGIFEPQPDKGNQRKSRDDERAATLAALTGRAQPADGGGRIIDITPGHAADMGGPDLRSAGSLLRRTSG